MRAKVTTTWILGLGALGCAGNENAATPPESAGAADAAAASQATPSPAQPGTEGAAAAFVDTFDVDPADWTTVGRSPWFVLEPGYVLVLRSGDAEEKDEDEAGEEEDDDEGATAGKEEDDEEEEEDEDEDETLTITVLDETVKIGGVDTRVVEERETEHGQLVEVSRNYVAMSKRTGDAYYFGEDVDIYRGGKVVGHGGSWRAGANGARFGLLMPGMPRVGARYFQEVAPGIAMDRAEVVSVQESFACPAGKFEACLVTEETTPLEPGERERKVYAPGIGLLADEDLRLVKYGKAK